MVAERGRFGKKSRREVCWSGASPIGAAAGARALRGGKRDCTGRAKQQRNLCLARPALTPPPPPSHASMSLRE